MKCERCGKELTKDEAYSHQSMTLCEDCYLEIGLHPKGCDPWASYIATHTRQRAGQQGTEGLTELQKSIYELIKRQGKATREEVMRTLDLSEAEMDAQITSLLHSELVKERSEAGQFYLIPVV